MKKFRIALGQICGLRMTREALREQMSYMAAEAAEQGAELILFPELSSIGYFHSQTELELLTGADDSDFIAWATRLSQKNRIGICAGYAEHAAGQRYNTSLLTGRNGEIVGKVRKVHLWKSEKKRFAAGNEYPVFETEFGKLAVLLCYDMEFPEPARIAALRGAELILCPAAWSKPAENRWRLALPASALFNLCFVAGANYSDALCCGGSAVYGPDGAALTVAEEGEALVITELDPERVRQQRETLPYFQDLRAEDMELLLSGARQHLLTQEKCEDFRRQGKER